MGSTIAAAIQRRFVIGPLVALALVGPSGASTAPTADLVRTDPTPTTTPTQDARALARDTLLLALDAERVYYVDNTVFASGIGHELEELQLLEKRVAWGTAVIVEVPASTGADSPVVVLRAPLPTRVSLCLAEVTTERDAGTWYARAGAGKKCPKPSTGMRGWKPDQATGWGA